MKRRDFLKLAGTSTACSVFVSLNGWGKEPPKASSPHDSIAESHDAVSPKGPSTNRFSGEPNMTLVDLECDFFVAGGGMAGACAAIAAARHGAKVILVQDRSRLGGNASSEIKMHVCGADMSGGRPGWREGGILEEIRLDDAVNNPQRSGEMLDLLLYDKLKSEPNVTLLLDTSCCAAQTKDGRIQQVMARCDKTEHLYRVRAEYYADCTGDCRLGLEAGAEMRTGREAKAEFGESLAPEKANDYTLGSSILFTSRDYGKPMPFTPPSWARTITPEMVKLRRSIKSWEYGYWWIEWGGMIDTIRDNERIRFELLSIALGIWDYIKNSGACPSSQNWALDWLGMVPGKRGSRRIVGDHILTEDDLTGKNPNFQDAVCIGGWSLDDHPSGGFDNSEEQPCHQIRTDQPYNIPLRSLYSRNIANLFMAGRNISQTHVAFTSTRVMATTAVMGQAIGTAAAYCTKNKLAPRQLATESRHLHTFQQTLLRDDQTIRDLRNSDPLDLARKAVVSASACLPDCKPENIINGFVRDLPKKRENRWAAKLAAGESVHVQFEWKSPQRLRRIQLTFDTGFHRPLTLTHQDNYNARMIRAAQPETVRDYELFYRKPDSDKWISLGRFTGNYQRLRRHKFKAIEATALRVQVTATNGSDVASIYEVRCYA